MSAKQPSYESDTIDLLSTHGKGTPLDESAKKLMSSREIIARLLKAVVPEFKGHDVETIRPLIGNVAIGGVNYHLTGRKIDLFFADVDIIPLTYLSAFLGIFFLIIVSHVKTYRIICYIGRNSLLIFAWHLIVYNWLGRLYDYLGIFQTPLPLYMIIVRDFMSLFLILLILIPINEMILHSRFKFVLGRG